MQDSKSILYGGKRVREERLLSVNFVDVCIEHFAFGSNVVLCYRGLILMSQRTKVML